MWAGAGLWVAENLREWFDLAAGLALMVSFRMLTPGLGCGFVTPIFQVSIPADFVKTESHAPSRREALEIWRQMAQIALSFPEALD